MGSALGDSLQNTVSSVIQIETKRLAANKKVNTTVAKELMQDFQAEEATFRIKRIQHQEQMTLRREKTAAMLALKEADASLKKARKDQKRVEKATAAMASAKAFTLTQLGQGKRMVAFRQTRSTVPKYSIGFEKLRNCRPNKHATGVFSSALGMRQWRRPMELIGEGFLHRSSRSCWTT